MSRQRRRRALHGAPQRLTRLGEFSWRRVLIAVLFFVLLLLAIGLFAGPPT